MGIRTGGILGALLLMAFAALPAQAQNTTIGVNQPGPVVKQQGLLGTYYTFTSAAPPGTVPGSPITPVEPTAAQFLQRIDPTVNYDFVAEFNAGRLPGKTGDANNFMIKWEGFYKPNADGAAALRLGSDDGLRFWFVNIDATADLDFWVQRGTTYNVFNTPALTNGQRYLIRLEWEQGNGGATAYFQEGANVIVPSSKFEPPDGPDAPALTLTVDSNNPVPQVVLNWTAAGTGVPATSWIVSRGLTAGGPKTQVYVNTATTFTDTGVAFGTTYYYVVQGTANTGLLIGTPSTEQTVTLVQPAVTVSPTTGLVTTESGGTATLNVTFNQAAPAGTTLVVSSADATEGLVSNGALGPATTINIPVAAGFTGVIPITITGQDDFVADGPVNYNINTTVATFGGLVIPPVTVSNTDNDTPGISVSPTAIFVGENGGVTNFLILLNSQPTGDVVIDLTSSAPTQFSTTPQVTLNGTNWNTGALVTITGIDDNVIELPQTYALVTTLNTGATVDPLYDVIDPSDISVTVNDDEVIPEADEAWGCGALGLEAFGVLVLLALRRRRRA